MRDWYQLLGEISVQWKNLDPALYEKFLRVLDALTTDVTVAVTEAQSQDILQAQGRAQQIRKLYRVFSEDPTPRPPSP